MKINVLLLLLCITTGVVSAQGNNSKVEERNKIAGLRKQLLGKPLTDFSFTDVDGNKLDKKELEGKVIVINFWYTSCGPCISEMPLLNELVDSFKGKDVVFLAPALDTKERISKFLQKHQFNYQIFPEQDSYAEKLKLEYFPTHIITDRKGIIRQVKIGYDERVKDILTTAINELLKK